MGIIVSKNKYLFEKGVIEEHLFMFDGTTSKPLGKEEDGDW